MTGSANHISKPLDAAGANNRETHVGTSRLVLFDFWLVKKIVGDFSVNHKELQNKTTIIRIWLLISELKLSLRGKFAQELRIIYGNRINSRWSKLKNTNPKSTEVWASIPSPRGMKEVSHGVLYDPSHTEIVHLSAEEHETRIRTGMGDWAWLCAFPWGYRWKRCFSKLSK